MTGEQTHRKKITSLVILDDSRFRHWLNSYSRFFLDSKIQESLGLSVMTRWLADFQNEFHFNINGSWNKDNKRLLEKKKIFLP